MVGNFVSSLLLHSLKGKAQGQPRKISNLFEARHVLLCWEIGVAEFICTGYSTLCSTGLKTALGMAAPMLCWWADALTLNGFYNKAIPTDHSPYKRFSSVTVPCSHLLKGGIKDFVRYKQRNSENYLDIFCNYLIFCKFLEYDYISTQPWRTIIVSMRNCGISDDKQLFNKRQHLSAWLSDINRQLCNTRVWYNL